MSLFIILNANQAGAVRGPTMPPAALEPIERQRGMFILGVAVLEDPAHAMHHELLSGLPLLDIDDPDFPPAIEE